MEKTTAQLRDERMLRIARQVAEVRVGLEGQIVAERGRISPGDALLLDSLCEIEKMRLEAVEQVQEKGLRERYSNGRQTLERENKAVGQALKAAATQAKLISALRLGQKSRAAPVEEASEADAPMDDAADEVMTDDDDGDINDY